MNRRTWLVVSVPVVALGALFAVGWEVSDRHQRSHETIARAKYIVLGCDTHPRKELPGHAS